MGPIMDRRLAMTGLLALAGVGCRGARDEAAIAAPEGVLARRVIDELLSRRDFMEYKVGDVHALHYAEAAAIYGAARLAAGMGDRARLQGIKARYDRAMASGIPNTENHVDANVIGAAPLELHLQGFADGYRERGLFLARDQWEDPRPDGLSAQTRFWIDDVWMIGLLQMQAYRVSGETIFLDRAALTTAAYLDRLQEPNGLFHHGPEAPFFWGRGNGWVAAGLAEVMADLPGDHPSSPRLQEGYRRMMTALLDHQAPDGMWRQLIDREESWKETSGTAMFGFALARGVRRGQLTDPAFADAAERAWQALQPYVDEEGRLRSVCVGTGQSQDATYYLERPTVTGDLHGQAPLMWFAAERLAG